MTNTASRTRNDLAILRVVVFGMWVIKLWFDDTRALGFVPPSLAEIPGPLGSLPHDVVAAFWSPAGFSALCVLLLVLLTAAAMGTAMPISGAVATLLLFVHASLVRGFGFVNHAELGLWFAAVFLCATPVDDVPAIPRRRGRAERSPSLEAYRFPFLAMQLLFYVAYTFVGTARFTVGGLHLFRTDVMQYWLLHRSLNPLDGNSELGRVIAESSVLFPMFLVGFLVVTVFEALSLCCLFSNWFRWSWFLVMIVFHATSPFVMCINFWENVILLVMLFVVFPRNGFTTDGAVAVDCAETTVRTRTVTSAGEGRPDRTP